MKRGIESILSNARKFWKGCKNKVFFENYKRQIDRAIAPEEEKKTAVIMLAKIMEVTP